MSFGSQGYPSNLTFYVGCDNEREECGGQTICLRRGNQNLVVQGPSVIPLEYSGTWGKDPAIDEAIKDGLYGRIEKIQTLLSTIPFGSKNWAYFITKKDGTYSLVYRERKLYQVTTPPWAPLVDEREILVTKMISPEEHQGIWDGKEVDLFMGWNEKYRRMLDRIMRAHNLLRGLDLTFEVLGHVTNSDGEIVGIMTEPAYGRYVEYSDRTDVYEAIAKIQSRSLWYSFDHTTIMVSKGKIRIESLMSVHPIPLEQERLADKLHSEYLDYMFDVLSVQKNFFTPFRYHQQIAKPLPGIPSPSAPMDDFVAKLMRCTLSCNGLNPEIQEDSKSDKSRDRAVRMHRRFLGSGGKNLDRPYQVVRYDPIGSLLSTRRTKRFLLSAASSDTTESDIGDSSLLP